MAKRETAKERETTMKDEHYDLVSVLYHALQGQDTLDRYIEDADTAGDSDLVEHYRDVQEQYGEIAIRTKELLRDRLGGEEMEEEEEDE